MEEIITNVIKELPSTGVLVLFVWFVGKQFEMALSLLKDHLEQLNKMIEICISKAADERTELRQRISILENLLTEVAHK